jgi:hypothetical protein
VSYGKATPYFPALDLLKRYAQVDDHDDAQTIRAKVTGHVLTLDETLQETLPALLWLLEALPEDSSFCALSRPSAVTARSRPCNDSCYGKARCSRCWSSRTCIGLILRPRRCWTVWSSGCRQHSSCF